MLFTSPIWLVGLLPWSAVALYILSGRPKHTAVPFLALWSPSTASPQPRRALRRPPLFLALMLASMLLAILAAAGPAARAPGSATPISIILDRGVTMSPLADRQPSRGVIALADAEIRRRLGMIPVDLVSVPESILRTNTFNWATQARALPPTALQTRSLLQQAINE